ncbi:MAG: protein kinase [Alphaproteobacteria bacterium]|nr:protein kinase [Alphaproteobacteria bacterium]
MHNTRARPLLNELPLPLAQLLLRALNAKSSVEHHHCAFYLTEAAIKLGAASRIGLWLSGSPDPEHPLLPALQRLVLPSMGHWRGLIRDLDRELSSDPKFAAHPLAKASLALEGRRLHAVRCFIDAAGESGAISRELRKSSVRAGVRGFLDVLVQYRNEVLGHGAQRDEAFYGRLGPLLLAAALELLDSDTVLGGLSLVVPTAALESGHPVTRWVGLTGLAGLPVATPPNDTQVVPGHLYLAGSPGLVALHPLVVWVRAPNDPLGRVGFLNKAVHRSSEDGQIVVRRSEYLDYTTGQALPDVDCREELTAFLARVGDSRGDVVEEEPESAPGQSTFGQPDPTPLHSRPIVGDFELLEELGRGGMGIVWRARQLGLGRIVALKVLSRALAADPTARERFQREIRALARSDHPNVVRVLSDGEEDGQLYYAMEYVDGADLSHIGGVLSGWRSQGARLDGNSLGAVVEEAERPPRRGRRGSWSPSRGASSTSLSSAPSSRSGWGRSGSTVWARSRLSVSRGPSSCGDPGGRSGSGSPHTCSWSGSRQSVWCSARRWC